MKRRTLNFAHATAAAMALVFAGTGASHAQGSEWDYGGFIYLWGAGMSGSTVTGEDFDISFSDVVEKLDFALMGAVEARRDRISFLGDLQYLNLSEGKNAAVGPGIPVTVDAALKGTVLSGSVGYDVRAETGNRVVLFGGFRYLDMDIAVNTAVGGGSSRVSRTLRNLDAIVGVRGRYQMADRWHLSYLADIGAGESDLTWQALVTLDYRINNWDLSFGLRHMEWDVSNSPAVSGIAMSGPFIGAKFYF